MNGRDEGVVKKDIVNGNEEGVRGLRKVKDEGKSSSNNQIVLVG